MLLMGKRYAPTRSRTNHISVTVFDPGFPDPYVVMYFMGNVDDAWFVDRVQMITI